MFDVYQQIFYFMYVTQLGSMIYKNDCAGENILVVEDIKINMKSNYMYINYPSLFR